jgi:hypothetical protein
MSAKAAAIVADIKRRQAADSRVMLTRRQCQQGGNWGPTSQIAKENAGDLDSVLDGSVRKITAASFYRHLIELAIRSHPPAGPVKARQPAARYQRRCPRRESTQAELEALKRGNERRRCEAEARRAEAQARREAKAAARHLTHFKKKAGQ